jgi:integrase
MNGRIYENKGGYVVRFGRDISKWFKHQQQAERFLNGLRYENDKGTYDKRDYQKDRPLAFMHLAEQYVEFKRKTLKPNSFRNIKRDMSKAMEHFGYSNVKVIGYAEIEDFLYSQNVSDKTRANMNSCLHDFFTWLRKRKVISLQQFPEFPEIKFELGWRNIIDIPTQQKIIAEVYRISHHISPKIWIGIKFLATYISVRPGELRNLKEGHISLADGFFIIPHPKEKQPKIIYLLDEDIEVLREIPSGLPELYFFRHHKGNGAAKPGSQFGKDYFYKWWRKACVNLGIEGVDLYGGTRHSTATALGRELTPEQIKAGTLHKTNQAFERYFQSQQADAKMVYQTARNLQHTYNQKGASKNDKLLKFK